MKVYADNDRSIQSIKCMLCERTVVLSDQKYNELFYFYQVAKDSSVEKLIMRLKEWYLNKEGMSA